MVDGASGTSPRTPAARPRSVLVVDDEEDIRETLREWLERSAGVQVRVAGDGAAGLALLRQHRFGVVVADYRMPAMDGVAFLRLAATQAPGAARVLITAHADVPLAVQAVNEAQVDRLLTKPMGGREFLQTVQDLLVRPAPEAVWRREFVEALSELRPRHGHET